MKKDKIWKKKLKNAQACNSIKRAIKSGEGKFEKFMGWMQSDEGMSVRASVAHVEKTVPAIAMKITSIKVMLCLKSYSS